MPEAAARLLCILGVLLALGALGHRLLLLPLARSRSGSSAASGDRDDDRWAGAVGAVGVAIVCVGLLLRLVVQTVSVFGYDALTLENLRIVGVDSRWGGRFRLQAGAVLTALPALLLTRRWPRLGWTLASAALLSLALVLPLTGHAASHGAAGRASQALHVLGAGLWIGTLAVTALRRGAAGSLVVEGDAPLLRSFAPIAAPAAGAVVLAGGFSAWLFVPDLQTLGWTAYGRLLVTKIVLALGVAALGFLNFRRLRRGGEGRAQSGAAAARGEHLPVVFELGLALAVVAVTALLGTLPPGGEH